MQKSPHLGTCPATRTPRGSATKPRFSRASLYLLAASCGLVQACERSSKSVQGVAKSGTSTPISTPTDGAGGGSSSTIAGNTDTGGLATSGAMNGPSSTGSAAGGSVSTATTTGGSGGSVTQISQAGVAGTTQVATAGAEPGNAANAGTASTTADPAPTNAGAGGTQAVNAGNTAGVAMADVNAAGAANSGGAPAMPVEEMEVRGPTVADATANFPFPQNRSTLCNTPTQYSNADVVAAFEKWTTETVTSDGANGFLRIKRTPSDTTLEPSSTVSEGIAYGMLIGVYMNDQNLFDQLWGYNQNWLGDRGLMHWYINAAGTEVLGEGPATDADEDIAFALVMADRQWGGGGSLGDSYANLARELIDRIWDNEIIDGKGLIPGGGWGDWNLLNVSYFAPSHYRTFATFTGNEGWNDVVATSYDVLEASLKDSNGNTTNGLVPAWSTGDGDPVGDAFGVGQDPSPTHYQYDSCRTPFRIGMDYCLFGEPRALSYVQKTSAFFGDIGAANMTDGYNLDGSPRPQYDGYSAAFIGTAAVGAMHDASFQTFLDDSYDMVAGLDLMAGGAYYDLSWSVITLLAMTGNLLDYTLIEPVLE